MRVPRDVEEADRRVRPELGAAMARVDVGSQPAADVAAREQAPEDLAGARVVQREARRLQRDGRFFVFVDAEDLEPGPRRIEIAGVQRVAVAQAGREESLAVVVDDHRAVDDFVLAVAVDVGDRQAVIALTRVGRCRRDSDTAVALLPESKTQRDVSWPFRQSQAARTVRP